jgi:hypothetical protein
MRRWRWRARDDGAARTGSRPLAWLLPAALVATIAAVVATRQATTRTAIATSAPERPAPRLVIEAPPSLPGPAAELRWLPAARWQPILDLVGLRDPGAPIRVLLVTEDAPLARRTPRWITGFAVPGEDTVVLLPERVLSYPHDSLAALLSHEVAHVLLARAAGGGAGDAGRDGELPRWFQEGVALLAGRDLAFADRERLLLGGLSGVPPSTRELQRAFDGEGYGIDTAYALAGALAAELVREHGRGAVAAIAAEVARGRSFAPAFAAATGEPLESFEAEFWRGFRWRYRWVPFLTSGATLWLGVTALALVAAARRRRRDAALRRRWEEEDAALLAASPAAAGEQAGSPPLPPPAAATIRPRLASASRRATGRCRASATEPSPAPSDTRRGR